MHPAMNAPLMKAWRAHLASLNFDSTVNYIKQILEQPDYIIKDKRPNTGLVIKQIISCEKNLLLVLRICTSCNTEYKNSIITSWEISETRLQNYLKNKQILYKKG